MARQPSPECIERIDPFGQGFFVRCDWHADRWRHVIGVVFYGDRLPILESIEGCPDDAWPPSPPLQQILAQTIDGNPALLAIGMSGGCHWSASFVLLGPDTIELSIETACLIPESMETGHPESHPPWPGTSYAILSPGSPDIGLSNGCRLIVPCPGRQAAGSSAIAISISGDRLTKDQERLSIAASSIEPGRASRWTLRFAFVQP